LFVLSLHNTPQAEAWFKNWIRQNRIENATVSSHRMMLHDQHGLERFKLTWPHSIVSLSIWDTWHRRHIYLD